MVGFVGRGGEQAEGFEERDDLIVIVVEEDNLVLGKGLYIKQRLVNLYF